MNNFDRVAPIYDLASAIIFGNSLRKAQACFLSSVPPDANVLILGGGTGYVLERLLSSNSTCRIWYVEPSQEMIDRAKRRPFADNARTRFIHGTLDNIDTTVVFDVIVMQFFLDLFSNDQVAALLSKLDNYSHSKTAVIAADFVNQKWWHDAMLRVMYRFFGITAQLDVARLPDWNEALDAGGYAEEFSSYFYGTFIKAGLFLKKLR